MGYTTRRRFKRKVQVSNKAQKMINDHGFNIADIPVSKGGKITVKEVKSYINSLSDSTEEE